MEEDGLNPHMVSAVICELGVVTNLCDLIEDSPVAQNVTEVLCHYSFVCQRSKGNF